MRAGLISLLLLAAGFAQAEVQVAEPYVRATVPGAQMSAAFATLFNPEDDERHLVAVSSSVAKQVELHDMVVSPDGVMNMQKVEQITIPAKGTLMLKPGSLHIMLLQLTQPLPAGTEVPLTLTFDNGQQVQIQATAREVKPAGHHHPKS
ncbi:MAG: copper chaperone PCu(A)C [Plesiomonas shigelloides]|uniref:copper chaperone PCu(A)C n=1 Tax=Plesiomonas shigelloides TaxID=703 RepID=UPI0022477AFA|nr:copper chaperone PCu(A)C [Plesiomonas shigelloides]MCX2497820.1 copper chaperone PCu(A)C [Plesiomonas shigelloides]